MPWSGQNGNNGGRNGGGDGPWGPRNRGGGNQQPDIEELFKKSQDRLKRAIPGGGNGKSGGPSGPIFFLFIAGLAAIVGWLAFTVKVNPDQVGIVTQFGKYNRTLTEGLHLRLPSPVEQIYLIRPNFAQKINIGGTRDFTSGRGFGNNTSSDRNASMMLTGDNNIVDVQFTIQWNIKDAKKFLFNVERPAKTVREVAESAMREVVGQKTLNEVLNKNFDQNQDQVQTSMQRTLDEYDSGINVREVVIGKPDVPNEVIKAVNDVEAAKQDKERLIQEARAYINKVVPEARGAASRITQKAEAYKARVVAEAQGEAERFKSIYSEYKKAPEVTRERLYIEMMERVFSGTDKIILDNDGKSGGVVPYLPLNELNKKPAR